jgi:hypothetical protein
VEDTLVTGAMIEVTTPDEPRLVALWVFSIMGDETVEYDLEDAKEDVWRFIEENEVRRVLLLGHNWHVTLWHFICSTTTSQRSVSSGEADVSQVARVRLAPTSVSWCLLQWLLDTSAAHSNST